MRKAILATAFIGVIAFGVALGVTQRDTIMNWLTQSAEVYNNRETAQTQTEEQTEATAEQAAADTATETTAEATTEEMAAAPATPIDLNNYTPPTEEAVTEPAAGDATAEAASEDVKTEEATAPAGEFKVDVAAALKDREVGSADAPLVIEDFSSLTCPHCAKFHNEIYPKIKADYIDTGKVRWIYRGFPLNDAALRAEMVARCAPNDQYVKIVDLLFSNQQRWAYADDPIANLSVLLRVAGITDEMFLACANNNDLMQGLLKATQTWGQKYNINATPTFVINGGKHITGAGSHEGFVYDLERELRELSETKQSEIPAEKTTKE